jgi:RNA polymerase sigma-70 factor (ECF subfamily)
LRLRLASIADISLCLTIAFRYISDFSVDLYSFDDDYVRRLRDGDPFAQEHFHRYFGELIAIKLRRRVRSGQELDDIRQEVFVRVFRILQSADGLRDGRKLGSFVNSVCNNVLMETLRQRAGASLDATHEEVADPATPADEALVTAESRRAVDRAIAELDAKDARLLRALFLDERPKDDICSDFGVDRNYLRVLLHRAKERFRAVYGRGADVVPLRRRETKIEDKSLR